MPGWRLEKTRAGSGERDPVFTVCLPLPLPLPSRACRARESTVSPILMYLRGRGLPVGFSPGPGPCLHLYRITRTQGSGLESCAWKTPDPLLPFAPLWPLHPRPARWYRSGVRSQGAGKVVSLFVSMDDETVRSNLTNLSERVRSSS